MKLEYKRLGQAFVQEVTVEGDEDAVVIAGLSQSAVEYLLQYGWTQSLQDAIAGREKKVREEYADKPDEVEAAVEADLLGAIGKRMDGILNGTLGVKTVSDNSFFAKVARDMLAAVAEKHGKKLPKKASDEYKELFERFCANKKAEIELEVAKRKENKLEVDFEF